MVLRHFNLREQPFGVTPDPKFLMHSATHREALAALLYGIESGLGFIALIANPGMGKTTLLFEALGRLRETTRTVFLFQAITTPTELVRALLIDLGEKDPRGTLVDLETRLNEILVEQSQTGKRLVVVLDEAQNLPDSVLEAVRMLSNFETPSHKLLQIVLSGQLQLADKLAQPNLLQLRQRISIFAYLRPLSEFETAEYIRHRLRVAGYESDKSLFTPQAMALIARQSSGTPRNINNLCFNSLSLACAMKKSSIGPEIVKEAIADLNIRREASFERITVIEADLPEEAESERPSRSRGWIRMREWAVAAVFFAAAATIGSLWLSGRLPISRVIAEQLPKPTAQAAAATTATAQSTAATPLQTHSQSPIQKASAQPTAGPAAVEAIVEQPIADVSTAPTPPPVASAEFRSVEVREGQSLSKICAENFGECQPEILNRIIRLNPRISDPDHIQSGQKVILPVLAAEPAPIQDRNPDERVALRLEPKRGTR